MTLDSIVTTYKYYDRKGEFLAEFDHLDEESLSAAGKVELVEEIVTVTSRDLTVLKDEVNRSSFWCLNVPFITFGYYSTLEAAVDQVKALFLQDGSSVDDFNIETYVLETDNGLRFYNNDNHHSVTFSIEEISFNG